MDGLWVVVVGVALLTGTAASVYLWTVKRRRLEAEAGLDALSVMRLREFSHFVLDAMKHRGFDIEQDGAPQARPSDSVLLRDGKRWLLSCRHGKAQPIASMGIREMVDATRLQRTDGGGLLVTTGDVEPEARKAARKARIEVLSGAALWVEIAPFLPDSLKQEVRAKTTDLSKRLIGFAWLGALALGVATWLATDRLPLRPAPAPAMNQTVPVQAKPPVVIKTSAPVPAPAATAATESVVATAPETTPSPRQDSPQQDAAQQARTRSDVAKTISDLPGIDHAVWSSRSTLLVHLQDGQHDPLAEICNVLERHETLVTSRLLLQPPPGSGETVRFRQCQAVWSSD